MNFLLAKAHSEPDFFVLFRLDDIKPKIDKKYHTFFLKKMLLNLFDVIQILGRKFLKIVLDDKNLLYICRPKNGGCSSVG